MPDTGVPETTENTISVAELTVRDTITNGRKVIYTSESEITADNVVDVLRYADSWHQLNVADIDWLYAYWHGKQPILYREKEIRPEIKNTVVENHAYSIVSFYSGYVFADPIQYVRRAAVTSDDVDGEKADAVSLNIGILNEYMFAEDKTAVDKEVGDWALVCGVGVKGILADGDAGEDKDDSPFEIQALDPRLAFVVYSRRFGNRPMLGVQIIPVDGKPSIYACWTEREYFEIQGWAIRSRKEHTYGEIPVVEYPLNSERIGVFQPVLPLLNAINNVQSNRLDGIEQFIQSFTKFINVDIDENEFESLRRLGAIKVFSDDSVGKADVDIVSSELNQEQTQTLVDHLVQQVHNLVGIPDRGFGKRTTGDTGQAVMLRDGWSDAETRAKGYELMFKRAEKQFIRIALNIMSDVRGVELRPSNIDIKFTRNRSDNLLVKTQGLQNMLEAGVHPHISFGLCGLFSDPEQAYLDSEEYLEKWKTVERPEIDDELNPDAGDNTTVEEGRVRTSVRARQVVSHRAKGGVVTRHAEQ